MQCDDCGLDIVGQPREVKMTNRGQEGVFHCCSEVCATALSDWLNRRGYPVEKALAKAA